MNQIKEKTMQLKNNEVKKVKNWNDSALNIYTRIGNMVKVEVIYRYAASNTITMTYDEFTKWQADIKNTKEV